MLIGCNFLGILTLYIGCSLKDWATLGILENRQSSEYFNNNILEAINGKTISVLHTEKVFS